MIDRTHPAVARRIRLSTGAIFAAIILTCAALLAVAAAVRPVYDDGYPKVTIEGPIPDLVQSRSLTARPVEAILPTGGGEASVVAP